MKNLSRFIAVVLCLVTWYQMFMDMSNEGLIIGFFTLFGAMLFMCFSIIAELKEEIERLRKGIDAYQKSMKYIK